MHSVLIICLYLSMSNKQKQEIMKTVTIKVVEARNKKYNNKTYTLENITEEGKTLRFKDFLFNGKLYDGCIKDGWNGLALSMWCGNGIINFDTIEII